MLLFWILTNQFHKVLMASSYNCQQSHYIMFKQRPSVCHSYTSFSEIFALKMKGNLQLYTYCCDIKPA